MVEAAALVALWLALDMEAWSEGNSREVSFGLVNSNKANKTPIRLLKCNKSESKTNKVMKIQLCILKVFKAEIC